MLQLLVFAVAATAVLAAPTRCTARDVLEQCKEFMPKFNRTDVIFPDTIEKFRYICEELGEFAECVGNATDVCIKHKTGDYTLKMLHAQVKLFSEACNKRGKLEEMVVKLGKCYSENLQDFFNYCGIGLPINEEDSKFQIKNKCKLVCEKETKEIQISRESHSEDGNVCMPSLWYYILLPAFDQARGRRSTRSRNQEKVDHENIIHDSATQRTLNLKLESPTSFAASILAPKAPRATTPEHDTTRERPTAAEVNEQLVELVCQLHQKLSEDRFDILGRAYAVKLRQLNKHAAGQSIIFEKLVSDAFYLADTIQLTDKSAVVAAP